MAKSYPWFIAVFACLSMLVSNGLTISGLSVYDLEFIEEFGWSMGQIKFRDMVTLALTGLLAPLAGIVIDRYGVRVGMLFGWLVLALGYFCYSRLETLPEMYFIHAAFAIVLVSCGLNVCVILVTTWFVRFRGTAIGMALVGTSLGGALFPQYGTAMIESLGWRAAFLYAMIFPVLMFLVTWLFVSDQPARKGLTAVGALGPAVSQSVSPKPEGVRYREAVRSRTFWALALIAMTTFYTVLGVQAHVYKYMRDAGFDAQNATNAISLFFLSALAGKFVIGVLSDLLDGRKVFYANMLIMLAGSILLGRMQPSLVWPAVIAFGLGWGGAYTSLQLTIMNNFGVRDAGKILGTITVLDAIGGGLGVWCTGLIYDATGTYQLPFAIFSGLVFIALLCFTQVKPLT